MSSWHRAGLFGLALLLPSIALADPKDDARRHFKAGLESAAAGDYEVALQRFLAAQEAYPHPATLYNIARAYQDLGDLENALTYYRLFRDAAPDQAGDVEPVIRVLEARINQGRTPIPTTAPVASGGGGGGGGGQVVVQGPAQADVERLKAISRELEVMLESFQAQREQALAAAKSGGGGGGGGGEPVGMVDPVTGENVTGEIPEIPGGGYSDEAYERIVVTASRYGQAPIDSPSTITVLTDEDIKMSGAVTVVDVLRRVVGVDVMELTAGQPDVSIRGFNQKLNNKVLVLVDGRSIYWDFVGATMWNLDPVALEEIERIEVIRGPGSAVYGANAVTGVVNIITKTPGDNPETLVKVDAGLPGLTRGTLYTTGRVGETSYRISANYHTHARWSDHLAEPAENAGVEYYFDESNRSSGIEKVSVNARLDRTFLEKGFLSLSGGAVTGHFDYNNIGALSFFGMNVRNNGYVRGDLAYGAVHLRAFWNHGDINTGPWTSAPGKPNVLQTDVTSDVVDVELEGNEQFETGPVTHRVNVGLGFRYKQARKFYYLGGYDSDIKENHYAAFLNEEATIDNLKVVASVRVDSNPLLPITDTISPRGAAIYRLQDTTSVRVTGGTAYRAPNMIESYMDFALPSSVDGVYIQDYGQDRTQGEWAPERITTVELGVHDESTLYHVADLTLFYNRVSDRIELISVIPCSALAAQGRPCTGYSAENYGYVAGVSGWENTGGRFDGMGVEAEAELFPVDGLDLSGNISVQQIKQTTDDGTKIDDKSVSAVKANFGATYRTGFNTDLNLMAHYSGPQTWRVREFDATGQVVFNPRDVDSRFILSGRIAVRPIPDENLEVSATVWNPLGFSDSGRFRDHPEGQLIGARAFGSVSYKF